MSISKSAIHIKGTSIHPYQNCLEETKFSAAPSDDSFVIFDLPVDLIEGSNLKIDSVTSCILSMYEHDLIPDRAILPPSSFDNCHMAIEFNCPFCKATIRVPENAGGGKGRCPKCAMRITVPKKSVAKPVARTTVDEEPFILPVADPDNETNQNPVPILSEQPVTPADTASVIFDPAVFAKPRIGEFPVERSPTTGSIAQRLKKQRKRNPSWMIGGVILLLLLATAGYFVYPQLLSERLTGDLIAGSAETLDLRPVLIDKSRLKLSPDELAKLLKKLEQNPVPLNSNIMQIQLAGTEKGLKISIAAGSTTHFYRVNLKGNDAVEKFLSRHISELGEQRAKAVDQAATEFLLEYEKVLAKESPPDRITEFRDSLALNSLVGGFGQELVAVHGRGLYRCIYEDRDGGLYFLLPVGVKEFDLIGRKHTDGRVLAPAEFKVKVQGEIAQPKRSDDEKSSMPDKNRMVKEANEIDKTDDDAATDTKR